MFRFKVHSNKQETFRTLPILHAWLKCYGVDTCTSNPLQFIKNCRVEGKAEVRYSNQSNSTFPIPEELIWEILSKGVSVRPYKLVS